jgi:hypothetical protein
VVWGGRVDYLPSNADRRAAQRELRRITLPFFFVMQLITSKLQDFARKTLEKTK